MNCKEIKELMSLKIDDLLSEDEEHILNDHLANCEECKIEYDQLIDTVSALNDLEMMPLPDDFKDTLHEKLLAEKKQSKINKVNWRKYSAIAAIFLIGIVAVLQTDLLEQTMNQAGMKSADMAVEESPETPMAMKSDGTYGFSNDEISEDMPVLGETANEPEIAVAFTSDVAASRYNEEMMDEKQNYLMVEVTLESKTSYFTVSSDDYDSIASKVEEDFIVDSYKFYIKDNKIIVYVHKSDYEIVIEDLKEQIVDTKYTYKEEIEQLEDVIAALEEKINQISDNKEIEKIQEIIYKKYDAVEVFRIEITQE